jgi:hypothetical protein
MLARKGIMSDQKYWTVIAKNEDEQTNGYSSQSVDAMRDAKRLSHNPDTGA